MQRNIFQRRKTFGITETDVLVANVANDARKYLLVRPPRLDRFVQNFKHAFARGPAGLNELVQLMKFADRIIKNRGQH